MPSTTKKRKSKAMNVSQQAVLADFQAAYALLDRGELQQYAGQFVAVLEGEVAGVDSDSAALRRNLSQKRGVDPERLAIIQIMDKAAIWG